MPLHRGIAGLLPLAAAGLVVAALAVPVAEAGPTHPGTTIDRPASPGQPAVTTPTAGPLAVLDSLTEAQRVGQLLCVGAPLTGSLAASAAAIRDAHAGSVILTGRSRAGVAAVAGLTATLRGYTGQLATGRVPLLVATDQEGGFVQTLAGPGFATIPTALDQGRLPPNVLAGRAQGWGAELAAAGVDLDLAPVADTVPPDMVAVNQPIGRYQREYGTDPATVAGHVPAVLRGLAAAGVGATLKHFPGLGRVVGNTDTTAGVTDTVTTFDDPFLAPFRAGIAAGATAVMVSLAIYTRIDSAHLAAFSPTVIGGMLRGELHFGGLVVSDDLGGAAAVASVPLGQRAVDFVSAGGDLVLTVDPAAAGPMAAALLARAQADAGFARAVDAAALRVLIAKQQLGLLGGAAAPVVDATGALRVAQRADDGSLVLRSAVGGGFGAPVALGGRLLAGPAAVALTGSAGVLAAVTGTDGAVYQRQWQPAGAGPWLPLGGHTDGAPALAREPGGGVDLAVRGHDGALWVRRRGPTGVWAGWQRLGGLLASAPAAVATATGTLVVAAVGGDGRVWLRVRGPAGWGGWAAAGGQAIGAPALTADAAGVQLYARGADSALWERTVAAGTGWTNLAGRLVGPPTASAGADQSTIVVGEGTDGRLYDRQSVAGGPLSGWALLPL